MAKKSVIYEGINMTTRDAVETILQKTSIVSIRQISNILGLKDEPGKARVRRALQYLFSHGTAKRLRDGVYQYARPICKAPEGQQKMWRAIRCNQQFNVYDIVLLTDASSNYIERYFKYLEEQGYIKDTGRKKDKKKIYRKTDKATRNTPIYTQMKTPEKPESWKEFEEKVWELVRLVLKCDRKNKPRMQEIIKQLGKLVEKI